MPEIKNEIGQAIKEARIRRGLSRKELGDAVHLSATQIYRIESGQSGINFQTLRRIAQALNLDFTALLDSSVAATTNTETDEVHNSGDHAAGWLSVGRKAAEYALSPQDVLEAIEILRLVRERAKTPHKP